MGKAIVKIADDPRLSEGFKKTSYPHWREEKACEDCGHKRLVKVTARKLPNPAFAGEATWRNAVHAELSWEPHCQACQAYHRFVSHSNTAQKWKQRWAAELVKQKARQKDKK